MVHEGAAEVRAMIFVLQAWAREVQPGDTRWMGKEILQATQSPNAPHAGWSWALSRGLLIAAADLRLRLRTPDSFHGT